MNAHLVVVTRAQVDHDVLVSAESVGGSVTWYSILEGCLARRWKKKGKTHR